MRLPVHVGRRPDEAVDPAVADGWRRLLALTGDGLRNGRWELLDASHESLLAWRLSHHLVVVNYGDREADGRIRLPDLAGGPLVLVDVLDGRRYERDGGELATSGLYVQLAPYGAHLFRIG